MKYLCKTKLLVRYKRLNLILSSWFWYLLLITTTICWWPHSTFFQISRRPSWALISNKKKKWQVVCIFQQLAPTCIQTCFSCLRIRNMTVLQDLFIGIMFHCPQVCQAFDGIVPFCYISTVFPRCYLFILFASSARVTRCHSCFVISRNNQNWLKLCFYMYCPLGTTKNLKKISIRNLSK